MLSLVIVCLALIASGSCLNPRIIGGNNTNISQHPYQVSIHYNNEFGCGGSIISDNWILTAAHCVEDDNVMLYKVRVGSTFYDEGGILISSTNSIRIAKIFRHNKYKRRYEYDAGLIKLSSSVSGPNIKKVLLAFMSQPVPKAGTQVVVTGWGETSGEGKISKILQKVIVPIIDQKKCENIYAPYRPVTSNMLCAGGTKKDTCKGDSGGALVYDGVQIGIVSWGPECATVGLPGVYTRVSAIRDWIDETRRKYSSINFSPRLNVFSR